MTATKTSASGPGVKRGFGSLPCPKCGAEATVSLDLNDVTDAQACRCNECDDTFGLADVRAWMERWGRVLAWIDAAPVLEE